MSHPERKQSVGLSSTSSGLRARVNPMPFPVQDGYVIEVSGGIPPYTFTAEPSPPNPPGVTITVEGNEAHVMVPPNTPPGTVVYVNVGDSSSPSQTAHTHNVVG